MRSVAATVLGVLAGCASGPPPPTYECAGLDVIPHVEPELLGGLPQLRPEVDYEPPGSTTSPDPTVTTRLHYGVATHDGNAAPLSDADAGFRYCAQLDPSFTATLGGLAAGVGVGDWTCEGPSGPVCGPPTVTFEIPEGTIVTDPTIVFRDDSLSLSLPLGNLLDARTAAPVGQDDWTFQAGAQVAFTWAPTSDLTDLSYASVVFIGTDGFTFEADGSADSAAGTITITLPDHAGDGTLLFELHDRVDRGTFDLTSLQTVSHDVTLQP